MSKKKRPAARAASDAPSPATSRPAHADLTQLDLALLELISQCAAAHRTAAEQAQAAGELADLVEQDRACLERVAQANAGPLSDEGVRAVFRELLSGARELVRPTRVVYLGPEFSFSHLAAVEHFGGGGNLVPVPTIAAVFDALSRRQADAGVVPVENSTDGRVADTLDMFARLPLRICGEVQLRIHHYLLGKCARRDVTAVYSKPQALSQCRTWLARHLPEARTVEMASTAAAAQRATQEPGAAAIASRQAGAHYGLDVIAGDIEDNRHNVTRFAVIGARPPARTGRDKTSLMFELPHEPGALADAMMVFKRHGLNLTWIESFPMPDTPNEYLFFVEFQGHPAEQTAQRALAALRRKTVRLEVLGSYPATQPVD
jgi:chorismate mutase / prephenate dehydratase